MPDDILLVGEKCPKCKSNKTNAVYCGSGQQIHECRACGHRFSTPCPSYWNEGT